MEERVRDDLIKTAWNLHSVVEAHCLRHPATKSTEQAGAQLDAWREKQRLLLADMAIHLLQTALKPGAIELDQLSNNLHAIMTIADQFLPLAQLKQGTEKLYDER